MMICTRDGDVDHGIDGCGAHIEDEHGAGGAGKQRADAERRDLVLGDIKAERRRFDRVLAARLQDQADRRSRQPEQQHGANNEEGERVPVVDVSIDRQHVGHGHADLTAGDAGENDDEVLQQQHGDERDQAEIGSAQPQRRNRQQDAADDGRQRSGDDADRDRQCRKSLLRMAAV